MKWQKTTLEIFTRGKGLHDITEQVRTQLQEWDVEEGMCFLFLPHTSASLVLSENWDPTARADLQTFMERLVPEQDTWYTHDLEGPDDATSHIRSMLTDTSLSIPERFAIFAVGEEHVEALVAFVADKVISGHGYILTESRLGVQRYELVSRARLPGK